jgi:regulator of protease activity HflC (stomatin/prohibitin superfamily)
VNQLFEWASRLLSSWKFWLVVPPWDIGVRVRLGRVAASLKPGPHLRIPLLDEIILVNTRVRLESTPTVTITSTAGRARVVTAQVGYAVVDPLKAMLRYTVPGAAVIALAQAKIAQGVPPAEAREDLNREFTRWGIEVLALYYVEDVEVRTYRFLQGGGGGVYSGSSPGVMPLGGGPNGISAY